MALGLASGLLASAFVVVLPGGVAAARTGGVHWTLTLPAVQLDRAGRAMSVSVVISDASEHDGEDGWYRYQQLHLVVNNTGHTSDARFQQTDSYLMDLRGERPDDFPFIHRVSLAAASVNDDGADKGDRYRLRWKFHASGPERASCDGHTTARYGYVSGRFEFRSQGSTVGGITINSSPAWLRHSDGTCGSLSTPPYPFLVSDERPCMHNGVGISGRDAATVVARTFVATREGDDTATIRVVSPDPAFDGEHLLVAVIPAEDLMVNAFLTNAQIVGEADGWISGSATEEASGTSPSAPAAPGQCVGNAVDDTGPSGPLVGSLTVDMGLAGSISVAHDQFSAAAFMETG